MQEHTNQESDRTQSIFPETPDLTESNKKINQGRGLLIFISIAQFLMGIYEYYSAEDKFTGSIAFGIDAFVAMIFLALALATKKKPFLCLTTGLVSYIVLIALFGFLDPTNLYNGALMKFFIIFALVKGVKAAKEAEAIRKLAGANENS